MILVLLSAPPSTSSAVKKLASITATSAIRPATRSRMSNKATTSAAQPTASLRLMICTLSVAPATYIPRDLSLSLLFMLKALDEIRRRHGGDDNSPGKLQLGSTGVLRILY